jgi:hypothetical protein
LRPHPARVDAQSDTSANEVGSLNYEVVGKLILNAEGHIFKLPTCIRGSSYLGHGKTGGHEVEKTRCHLEARDSRQRTYGLVGSIDAADQMHGAFRLAKARTISAFI